jgi:signal transduction histidine kinase
MAAEAPSPPDEERVLLVAPTRRDAEVTRRLLGDVGVACVVCPDLRALTAELAGGVGAVLITDCAFGDPGIEAFVATLAQQPPWSDVPVLVMSAARQVAPAAAHALEGLTNVTLLDRPVSTRSMRSAVLASLRARRRQYQLREHIGEQLKAEQALRDGDRRKDEFLATLAHELRNPLAPIRMGVDALARLPGDSEQAVRLREMMARQVGQLVKLIDELLDVSRIANGKVVLRRVPVDLRTVIDSALEASQPALEEARHEVTVELPNQPVWVHGDPSRLAQVVSNLLNNAAKYTPAGGHVRVELAHADGQATVRVVDDGMGIPAEMVNRVFDMFTQVDRTLDRAQGGLGIGLALVRRLMQLHGGSVRAQSEGLDRGSTFTVTLPASATQPPSDSLADHPAAHAPPRLRVLVVDDNVDAADALAIQLQCSGHATRTVYRGADALAAVADFAPDIVFCDIGMPGMNGHEVASRLRGDPRHAGTVLVALTGWGSEDDKRRTQRSGFDHHLVKPASWDAVDNLLSAL